MSMIFDLRIQVYIGVDGKLMVYFPNSAFFTTFRR